MGPRKTAQRKRKERNPTKIQETEDSELSDSSDDSTIAVVLGKKARTKKLKKYIGAHVSIAGKTHQVRF